MEACFFKEAVKLKVSLPLFFISQLYPVHPHFTNLQTIYFYSSIRGFFEMPQGKKITLIVMTHILTALILKMITKIKSSMFKIGIYFCSPRNLIAFSVLFETLQRIKRPRKQGFYGLHCSIMKFHETWLLYSFGIWNFQNFFHILLNCLQLN